MMYISEMNGLITQTGHIIMLNHSKLQTFLPNFEGRRIVNPRNFFITGAIGDYFYNKKEILMDMGVVLQGFIVKM